MRTPQEDGYFFQQLSWPNEAGGKNTAPEPQGIYKSSVLCIGLASAFQVFIPSKKADIFVCHSIFKLERSRQKFRLSGMERLASEMKELVTKMTVAWTAIFFFFKEGCAHQSLNC